MNKQLLFRNVTNKLAIACLSLVFFAPPLLANSYKTASTVEEAQKTIVTIKGKVTDEQGLGLAGVTIAVKTGNGGTITDVDGNYQLENVQKGQELIFSFIGMTPKSIFVGNSAVINVVLSEETTLLQEVVAIGYGVQQKKDITGSVSSVRSENFNKGIVNSAEQLIQGKVPGVNITASSGAPGAGQRIIIRGQSSLREGTGPLFVIDGFPVGLGGTGSDDSNPMGFINPDDIESIDVLKDASASAIYGTRGANGVILITTKSGKAGTTQLSVSSKVGVSNIAKKLPVFSADEFRKNVVAIGGNLIDRGGNTDWQDELTTSAITNEHTVTTQGGSPNFTFRASTGYLNQKGIVINTGIERYTANVKANQKLWNGKLTVDYSLNASVEKGDNSYASTLVSDMLWFNPTYKARDEQGAPIKYQDYTNPLIHADLYSIFSEKRRISANISPTIELAKGLTYKMNYVYENTTAQTDEQGMPNVNPYEEGYLYQSNSNGNGSLIENYLTYTLKQEKHSISAMVGHSYQENFGRWSSWNIKKFEANGIEPRYNPGLGQTLTNSEKPTGAAGIDKLQSYFGRFNYSYLERYLLTATVRADGSSKFGENNRYAVFPSFAAAWRITEEDFLKNNSYINNLKLRAGWGQTGNQEIPSKITKASFTTKVSGSSTYPLNNSSSYYAGTTYARLSNPNIQWEVTSQTNAGLDFAFFNGAFNGSFDIYNKVTSNILMQVSTDDPIQVAPTTWSNVDNMTITNKGWDLALDYQKRFNRDFSVSIGATLSYVTNKVEGSPYTILTTGSASGSGLTGATINGLINDYPVGSFYMKTFTGIGADGLSTYANDGELSVVGGAIPDYTYSVNLNSNFKRFDISANFNGVSGNMIYNNTAMNKFYKAQLANSSNTTAKAIEYANESILNPGAVSTRFLEDGAYFRLNNLSLGYSFNTQKMSIDKWIKDMKLSVSGQNLFVITKYSGFDPEVNQNRSIAGFQSFGIDLNGYPKSRTFSVGLNITLN